MTALATRTRHRRHANPFTLRGPMAVPDWDGLYGRHAPLAIDVGCGPGRFVWDLARHHPEWNVLGLEIRQHLIENTRQTARELGLPNVYALLANANSHLPGLLPPESVAFVAVNFPDPWYKKRHHKRRVVRPEWLTALAPALIHGAQVHAMTDYFPIAIEMRDTLAGQPGFTSLDPAGAFAPESTTGLTSEREQTHLKRGEPIYRLRFIYDLARDQEIL